MGRRKKKKRKSTPPKRWSFNRKKRLAVAKGWMQTYEGKYLIKGYIRRYKVDILCAIVELRMLGSYSGETMPVIAEQTVPPVAF